MGENERTADQTELVAAREAGKNQQHNNNNNNNKQKTTNKTNKNTEVSNLFFYSVNQESDIRAKKHQITPHKKRRNKLKSN